jgi:hypothetical protein
MGFQPMQAFFVAQMTRPAGKSKLAARGVRTFSSNKRRLNEGQNAALQAGLFEVWNINRW